MEVNSLLRRWKIDDLKFPKAGFTKLILTWVRVTAVGTHSRPFSEGYDITKTLFKQLIKTILTKNPNQCMLGGHVVLHIYFSIIFKSCLRHHKPYYTLISQRYVYIVRTFYFCGQRPPQLVVAEGNNIFEVRETHIRDRRPPYLLVAIGHKTF